MEGRKNHDKPVTEAGVDSERVLRQKKNMVMDPAGPQSQEWTVLERGQQQEFTRNPTR
jgi:hypothetical protein